MIVPPHEFVEQLLTLNQLMVSEESLTDTLQRVASMACMSELGANHVGVTLLRKGGSVTAAAHGSAALALDQSQYDVGDGPCLTAARNNEVVRIDSMDLIAERWPAFAGMAAAHGVLYSVSLPLTVNTVSVGALNLYSSAPTPFSEQSVRLGQLFAQQAAVAVANAEVYWRTVELTQNLEVALESRDIIGQAKGILMATYKADSEGAFAMLRRASQHLNIKLRDVADHVVHTGELPSSRAV